MKYLLRFYWSYRRQIKIFIIALLAMVLFVSANIVFRLLDDAVSGNGLSDTVKQSPKTVETGSQSASVEETAQPIEQSKVPSDHKYGEAGLKTGVSTASVTPEPSAKPTHSAVNTGIKSTTPTLRPTGTQVITIKPSATPGKGGAKITTPKPSGTGAASKSPSPSVVSSSAKKPGTVEVQYANSNTDKITNTVSFRIKLTNTGTTSVKLSDVKLRYYYSVDGEKKQNFWCDWSSAGSDNVNGKFVRMSSPVNKADYYLEIGFTDRAKSLEPGGTAEIQARFAKDDWADYDQSNDYSFNPSANGYTNWNKVTMYISGKLKYGAEP